MALKKTLWILALFLIPAFSLQAAGPIKILLVPGHDNESSGTQYGNIKEADMNLALANKLYAILSKDSRFQIWITRDWSGYTKPFADLYQNTDAIWTFEENAKQAMQTKITAGTFVQKQSTPHATASDAVALKLYGINKWADENNIDAVIHIHFNDYPRPDSWTIGTYKGFAVYMPDWQLQNGNISSLLAAAIFGQLRTTYIPSTYPKEIGGLVPDQKLIALGANNTLLPSVRSVLIEYGYIYQKIFRGSVSRHAAYDTMAKLTATGIKNYFFAK